MIEGICLKARNLDQEVVVLVTTELDFNVSQDRPRIRATQVFEVHSASLQGSLQKSSFVIFMVPPLLHRFSARSFSPWASSCLP